MSENLNEIQLIERSIIKKYRTHIWRKFVSAIDEYELVKEGDRIAVCISGGKDSFLMAKCFQELQKRSPVKFELVFLTMNPGYSEKNLNLIKSNADRLGIPLEIFDTEIFDIVYNIEQSPCYLCARMRRGYLYKNAQKRGCNKIALGHHFDDVVETIMLSMLYGAEYKTMMPKLHSTNHPGMELIRPMYKIREEKIKSWLRYNNLEFLQCACRFTEKSAQDSDKHTSKRAEIKQLIASLEKINPNVALNIFNSSRNVVLDTVIEYKYKGKRHNFLDTYDSYGYSDEDEN